MVLFIHIFQLTFPLLFLSPVRIFAFAENLKKGNVPYRYEPPVEIGSYQKPNLDKTSFCLNSDQADKVYNFTLERFAFGSCSKQYKNQPLWKPILSSDPQVYMWIGDVIYVKEGSTSTLRKSYQRQLEQPGYKELLSYKNSSIVIDGVYDDHDFGENDAGKSIYHNDRQEAYLNFLGESQHSKRRDRVGLYSSHTFGVYPNQVKIILLDCRSFRDDFFFDISWLQKLRFPLFPLLQAFLRYFSVVFRFGKQNKGDILGEAQWQWLENSLQESIQDKTSATIVVSTIQVLTTNPVIENWAQFPMAQKRLLELLSKYKPNGLTLLSGDVHFAEILKAEYGSDEKNQNDVEETEVVGVKEHQSKDLIEVTTSGMTHTCADTTMGALCKTAINRYSIHRYNKDAFYIGYNYGTIVFDWNRWKMDIDVRNTSAGSILHYRKSLISSTSNEKRNVDIVSEHSERNTTPSNEVETSQYIAHDIFSSNQDLRLSLTIFISLFLHVLGRTIRRRKYRTRKLNEIRISQKNRKKSSEQESKSGKKLKGS